MSRDATFWDNLARRYAKSPIKDMDSYEATLDRVRHYLRPEHRVIELGCGTGTTALKLAPSVAEILGTDISNEMIEIAREKVAEGAVANARFEAHPVNEAGSGGYDVALAFNLLHLVRDLPATLAHIHAILPEGGLFISKTPCLGRRKLLFKPLVAVMQLVGKAPYVSFLTVDALGDMICAAGFEIVETGDYPKSTPSRFIVARKK